MKILITGSNGQLGNELQSIIKSGKAEIGSVSENIKNSEVIALDVDKLDTVSYTHLTLPTSSERCRSRWSPYH